MAIVNLRSTFGPKPEVLRLLRADEHDRDDAVGVRAAAVATLARHPSVTPELRAEVLAETVVFFRGYGEGCTRSDKDWGWRVAGEALLGFGDDGQRAMEALMTEKANRRLAELAWRVLYLRQGDKFYSSTEEQDRAATTIIHCSANAHSTGVHCDVQHRNGGRRREVQYCRRAFMRRSLAVGLAGGWAAASPAGITSGDDARQPPAGPVCTDLDHRIRQEELADVIPPRIYDIHTHAFRWAFNVDPEKEKSPLAEFAEKQFPEVGCTELDHYNKGLASRRAARCHTLNHLVRKRISRCTEQHNTLSPLSPPPCCWVH